MMDVAIGRAKRQGQGQIIMENIYKYQNDLMACNESIIDRGTELHELSRGMYTPPNF